MNQNSEQIKIHHWDGIRRVLNSKPTLKCWSNRSPTVELPNTIWIDCYLWSVGIVATAKVRNWADVICGKSREKLSIQDFSLDTCIIVGDTVLFLRESHLCCQTSCLVFDEKNRVFYCWPYHWSYEPPHDKTNKMSVRPVKTQISLGIRPVLSESLLWAQWVAKDPRFLHADSEDSDQIGHPDWVDAQADLSLCWAHTHFVSFVMSRLNFL